MEKIVDKNYCMSSFLTYRYVADENKIFKRGFEHVYTKQPVEDCLLCHNAVDIDHYIRMQLKQLDLSRAALLLSGGIDSGILASYMPKNVIAYTANCPSPNAPEEIYRAKKISAHLGLKHMIVDITWQDYLDSMEALTIHDGCPVFANEPQVYTLAKRIKEDGCNLIIYGDNADTAFGGMDRLLSKDWSYNEWIERFTFLDPQQVLKDPVNVKEVYERYRTLDGKINIIPFLSEIFAASSSGAYMNAFDSIGIQYADPYKRLSMAEPLDLQRIRNGESKYLLRELYKMKFPDFDIPEKIAMARAVDYWLADWNGPTREEFLSNCISGLSGEQKFLLYSLELFLNILDDREVFSRRD